MVATGRVPNTKSLGLENMGIETFRGFVQVRDAARPCCDMTPTKAAGLIPLQPPPLPPPPIHARRWTRRCAC